MDFESLPRKAQRAAFAKMSAGGKAKKAVSAKKTAAAKKTGRAKPSLKDTFPVAGGGRITREEAMIQMFGTKGAAARIAKARAKGKLSD